MPGLVKTINAVAYYRDGGDGGGSFYVFNTLEELKASMFPVDTYHTREEQDKKFQSVLDEESPYEDGEICKVNIHLQESPDGTLRLAKPFPFLHWGQ